MSCEAPKRKRCRDNKKFGYDNAESAIPQLIRTLALENQPAIFAEIRKTLNSMCHEYLDIERKGEWQSENFLILEEQLPLEVPEHFGEQLEDIVKRKYFAHHACRYLHNAHRIAYLKKQRLAKDDPESPEAQPCRTPLKPLPDSPVINNAALNRRAVSCQPTSDKSVPSPLGGALPLKRVRKPTTKAKGPYTVPRRSAVKKLQFDIPKQPDFQRQPQTPSPEGTSSDVPSSSSAQEKVTKQTSNHIETELAELAETSPSNIIGLPAIRHFLSTCQPEMSHHYRQFVDIGCITEQYLFSISTWDPDKRYETLRKMLPALTPMDIMFLVHHFDTYFGHQR